MAAGDGKEGPGVGTLLGRDMTASEHVLYIWSRGCVPLGKMIRNYTGGLWTEHECKYVCFQLFFRDRAFHQSERAKQQLLMDLMV